MNRRPGTTLTEVLIAIFIVAIGLMSLLTLFPLGLLQMGQAIKDDRCAQAAASAEGYFRAYFKSIWVNNQTGPLDGTLFSAGALNGTTDAMDDPANLGPLQTPPQPAALFPVWQPIPPNPTSPVAVAPATLAVNNRPPIIPTTAVIPSYPMLIDPIGWETNYSFPPTASAMANPPGFAIRKSRKQWWFGYPLFGEPTVGQGQTRYIPRRTLPQIEAGLAGPNLSKATARPDKSNILRLTSLLDDISFDANASPDPNILGPNAVPREGRYKYAWFVRRPNNSVRTEVELTVIVYSGRPIDISTPERVLRCDFVQGSTSATIRFNAATDKPALRRGQWILDSTMVTFAPGGGNPTPTPHGFFYRVVDVDDSTAGILRVELQTPALATTNLANTANPQNTGGQVTILANVAEVFNKGIVSPYTTPALQ
jgi:hypothetical protein